ncbi:MAG: hypothetical protein GTO54_12905 [Nitrososphaeria archaeon]|nr:hypothetical protein [Nitrososphaeria archaeon]
MSELLQLQPTHHFHQGTPLTHTTTWPYDMLEDPAIGPLFVVLATVSLDAWYPKLEWENKDGSKLNNYTQIFVKTVDRIKPDGKFILANNVEVDQKGLLRKKCIESLRDINIAHYFGHAKEFTEKGHTYRTMGGLTDFPLTEITEQVFKPDVAYDEKAPGSKLNKSVWEHVFAHGSPVRWMFASEAYLKAANIHVRPNGMLHPRGMDMLEMPTELGTINVVEDKILDYNGLNLDAVILDLSYIHRRYLKNRDWHLIEIPENELDPSIDGLKVKQHDIRYRLLGELSLDVVNPGHHIKIMKELPKVPKGMHEGATVEEMRAA